MTCRRLIKFILFLFAQVFFCSVRKRSGRFLQRRIPGMLPIPSTKAARPFFGMQPMSIPVGVVEAVLQRDALLAETLRSQGLRIVFYPFLKGSDINAFMQRGDVDIAVAGDAPVVTAASRMGISILASASRERPQ
jgi:hypothetical protein